MKVNAATLANDPVDDPWAQTGRTGDDGMTAVEVVKILWQVLRSVTRRPM